MKAGEQLESQASCRAISCSSVRASCVPTAWRGFADDPVDTRLIVPTLDEANAILLAQGISTGLEHESAQPPAAER